MSSSVSLKLIGKYTAIYLGVTFAVGCITRVALTAAGLQFTDAGSQAFWHSIWFAAPGWTSVFLVFLTLARRHPQEYWATAIWVSALSFSISCWVLWLMMSAPTFQSIGAKYFLNSLYQQSIVIFLAALFSRRNLLAQVLPFSRPAAAVAPPNKSLERTREG
jgi:hypothetical protein